MFRMMASTVSASPCLRMYKNLCAHGISSDVSFTTVPAGDGTPFGTCADCGTNLVSPFSAGLRLSAKWASSAS